MKFCQQQQGTAPLLLTKYYANRGNIAGFLGFSGYSHFVLNPNTKWPEQVLAAQN